MTEFDFLEETQKKKEIEQARERVEKGEHIYSDFRVWCNAFKNGQFKDNSKVFAEYLAERKIVLNWGQRKHIAEKYFGYVFTYDEKAQDWIIEKAKKE